MSRRAANSIHLPDNLRPRECVCTRSMPDGNGQCLKCGKPLVGRCLASGLPIPECGCVPCARRLQLLHQRRVS